jgi:serine/threonine protein kinase
MPAGPESVFTTCPKCGRPATSGARSCAFCSTPLMRPQPRKDPTLGQVVAGRFRIEELVGQGGMGKVYRARHLSLERDVCIKMLKPALLEDPTLVGRFEREAKAASRLNHPNVIQVLDFGRTEDGGLYIAMEFVKGKDLRIVLRDEWPIPEPRLCNIIAQVLSALGEAHAHKVIHRDLKPENIMVEQRRDGDFVKVLDFGIAKILDSELPGLTRSDVVCGTPQYMAPEQATGAALDARCDLYAVGVILYQLVTGQLPFDGTNSMDVLNKHVNDRPTPPRLRSPGAPISEGMERLILRALEKDPLARPQTAEAFRSLALALASGVPAPSPATNLAPRDPTPDPTPAPPETPFAAKPAARKPQKRWQLAAVSISLLLLAAAAYRYLAPPSGTTRVELSTPLASRDPLRSKELVQKASDALSKEDAGGALAMLNEAISLDSGNAEAHYRLGGLMMLEGKPERARAEYELAKRLDPNRYGKQVDSIIQSLQ